MKKQTKQVPVQGQKDPELKRMLQAMSRREDSERTSRYIRETQLPLSSPLSRYF